MQHYKQLLLKMLSAEDWVLETRFEGTEWWAEEHWLIKSTRQNWGLELTLSFLADPHYEGREKAAPVWAVAADAGVPQNWLEAGKQIALMPMTKGKLNEKLHVFVDRLNRYRNEVPPAA